MQSVALALDEPSRYEHKPGVAVVDAVEDAIRAQRTATQTMPTMVIT